MSDYLSLKRYWITLTAICVLLMVLIGGYTRLTNSGLSITEWKPVTGTFPPFSEENWETELEKYKASPEYNKINYGISMPEFKRIYLIEYFHRLFGRITGFVLLVPALFFMYKKQFNSNETKFLITTLALGMLQALVGWIMVASGLIDNPHVSHYKLALHLSMATILFSYIIWSGMQFYYKKVQINFTNLNHLIVVSAILLLFTQIIWGAFVAGLDAGMIYNTFPLMNESFFPSETLSYTPKLINFTENHGWVQFTHRILGYVVYMYLFSLYFKILKNNKNFRTNGKIIMILLNLQLILGILTVVYQVPLVMALLHQLNALILLGSVIVLLHKICDLQHYTLGVVHD